MVKKQIITDKYAAYNGDCMEVIPTLPDNSVDLSVYSPPFAGLYNYSSDDRDFSNVSDVNEFMRMYEFLIEQIARVTKPGRITAVHCTDVMNSRTETLWDFPGEIVKLHEKYGFDYKNRITIWKEPMKVRLRTMVKSLMHVTMMEDATSCFPAMPDYVLIFRKKGECEVPVSHPGGLKEYYGELPLLPVMMSNEIPDTDDFIGYSNQAFKELQRKYKNFEGDHKENRLSHTIYRRYMSSVWDDIRIENVLPFRDAKSEDDEKHVHPLQLDVYDRLITLYTNPGEIVLEPFAGVGSGIYSSVSLGRKAVAVELKDEYFEQLRRNVEKVDERFKKEQLELF